jgi:uncharacterized protein
MKQSRYNVWAKRGGRRWVYNGLSGKLVAIPDEDWSAIAAFIDGDDSGFPNAKTLQDLVLGRMLVQDDYDELAFLERKYRVSRENGNAFALTIVTSLGCNFDCPYCYQAKRPSLLSDETQALILDVVDAQLPSIERFDVTWFGGEPLLGKDALLSLSDAFIQRSDAHEVEYAANIVTNGYLLTAEVATELRERRVSHAQVTLDGAPETHDLMRPLASGRPTFATILENLQSVVDILDVSIRVNIDTTNVAAAHRLLGILADSGLAGRASVYPGQLLDYNEGTGAPSETYAPPCLTFNEFADVEREFMAAAVELGLASPALPGPLGAPCTAVRANELVVGSGGELYKCWDSVGNHREVIGHLRSWRDPNDRILKWLNYDPFHDDECSTCVALPVCMGGCAHHAMDAKLHDSRCSTFRSTHVQQVESYVTAAESAGTLGSHHPQLLPLVQ